MKYILTEEQHRSFIEILKSLETNNESDFNPELEVIDSTEKITERVSKIIGARKKFLYEYLKKFGPFYLFKKNPNSEIIYTLQKQNYNWYIQGGPMLPVTEDKFLEQIGVAKYGVSIDDLLDIKEKQS